MAIDPDRLWADLENVQKAMQDKGYMQNPISMIPKAIWDELEKRQDPTFLRLRSEGKIQKHQA